MDAGFNFTYALQFCFVSLLQNNVAEVSLINAVRIHAYSKNECLWAKGFLHGFLNFCFFSETDLWIALDDAAQAV